MNEAEYNKQRTIQQNKALHKFCQLLADELNNAGYDMKQTLKEDAEIPWTMENVKNHLWRPIQKAMTQKESTTELNTVDPTIVHQVLMRHLSEKFGIYVDWPSLR